MASLKSKKPSPKKAVVPEEPKSGETPPESSGEEAEVERLREEVQQLQDNPARLQAELANSQKRHERDRAAAARYRVEPLARELLDILDAMEEAREAMAREENVPDAVREGQGLILRHSCAVAEHEAMALIRIDFPAPVSPLKTLRPE